MKNYTYEQYLADQEIADSLDFWQNRMQSCKPTVRMWKHPAANTARS